MRASCAHILARLPNKRIATAPGGLEDAGRLGRGDRRAAVPAGTPGEAAKAAAEAMKEQHLLAEGNDPAVTEYRFTALPPQAARQTARRMLGEDFTPRLLPLEKLTAFSTE